MSINNSYNGFGFGKTMTHRRAHGGCPLKPATFSGTPSPRPQALPDSRLSSAARSDHKLAGEVVPPADGSRARLQVDLEGFLGSCRLRAARRPAHYPSR